MLCSMELKHVSNKMQGNQEFSTIIYSKYNRCLDIMQCNRQQYLVRRLVFGLEDDPCKPQM